MLKVMIVDDELLFRKALIKTTPWDELGYEVCCEAENGCEALEKISEYKPDVALVDINMPIMDGLSLAAEIKRRELDVRVIIITGYVGLFPDLFEREVVQNTFDYYERRTYHMSSLSPNTASIIALRLGKGENAYKYLNLSSTIDLNDIQGNTKDGIHSAAAGGTWMACVYGFGGLTLKKNFELSFMPRLPKGWGAISYRIFWQGSRIKVKYDGKLLTLTLEKGKPVKLSFKDRTYELTDRLCLSE